MKVSLLIVLLLSQVRFEFLSRNYGAPIWYFPIFHRLKGDCINLMLWRLKSSCRAKHRNFSLWLSYVYDNSRIELRIFESPFRGWPNYSLYVLIWICLIAFDPSHDQIPTR